MLREAIKQNQPEKVRILLLAKLATPPHNFNRKGIEDIIKLNSTDIKIKEHLNFAVKILDITDKISNLKRSTHTEKLKVLTHDYALAFYSNLPEELTKTRQAFAREFRALKKAYPQDECTYYFLNLVTALTIFGLLPLAWQYCQHGEGFFAHTAEEQAVQHLEDLVENSQKL